MKTIFFMALLVLSPLPLIAQEEDAATEWVAPEAAEKKARPLPFRSIVDYVDEEHRAYFRMGKVKLRKVYFTPDTRFLLASGEVTTVESLRKGIDVRGSYRKRADGHYDAITIKIGAREN